MRARRLGERVEQGDRPLYGMMGALGRTIQRDVQNSTKPYAERRAPSGEGREYRLDPEAARVINILFEYDEHAGRGY